MSQREIGGDFHWPAGAPPDRMTPWPASSVFFARGRDAVTSVMQTAPAGSRLYVPHFFCGDTVAAWDKSGFDLCRFHLLPESTDIRFDRVPTDRDFVLLVNYFGTGDLAKLGDQLRSQTGCAIIEDHSHDPVSPWALSSGAEYCFASLRKTLPLTDGAIAWSPGGTQTLQTPNRTYSDQTLVAAMAIKAAYLAAPSPDPALKQGFRELQLAGHKVLEANVGPVGISTWSYSQIKRGYPTAWREARTRNASTVVKSMSDAVRQYLLFESWRQQQCPLAIVLVFQSETVRNEVRAKLIEADIYPPVHWRCDESLDEAARTLGSRILSIPVDQRYSDDDMIRVSEKLNDILAR